MSQKFNEWINFLSSPPKHLLYYNGGAEKTVWASQCVKEVFPGIIKHLEKSTNPSEDGLKAVQALEKAHQVIKDEQNSGFKDKTWKIIDKAISLSGTPVLTILCAVLMEDTSSLSWPKTVRTLLDNNHPGVAIFVFPKVLQRYSSRIFTNMIYEEEFYMAIEAIYTFNSPQKKEITKALLDTNDELLRRTIIEALARHGDKDAIPIMKKRLGNIFKKPEKDNFIRSRIVKAIEAINKRM